MKNIEETLEKYEVKRSIGPLVEYQMSNVISHMSIIKCQKSNVKNQMSNVICQMPNVNKVKLLSERTSGVPPVIFV